MYNVTILCSENKENCPVYNFENWEMAGSFIQFNIEHGYSCEVNGVNYDRED